MKKKPSKRDLKMQIGSINPLEHDECVTFVAWLKSRQLKFAHIPNETFTKSWKQKRKNKEEGVSSGLPDYIIITPRGLLFIEMKRKKGGVISPTQREWINALNEINGVQAQVCRGHEDAIQFTQKFLIN